MRCHFGAEYWKQFAQDVDSAPDAFIPGLWKGSYTQLGRKHDQQMTLAFDTGSISGHGTDDVGAFSIFGKYDDETKEARWVKRYVGRHAVFYSGLLANKAITGNWMIVSRQSIVTDTDEFQLNEPTD